MGGWFRDVWSFFIPPDPPVTDLFGSEASMAKWEQHMKAQHSWRQKVSGTLFILIIGVAVACFTPWGFLRQAQADEKIKANQTKVDDKMDTRLKAIEGDVSKLKIQGDSSAKMIHEIYKTSTATNICRTLARLRRETNGGERSALRVEVDDEQNKYKTVAGEYYPESRCEGVSQ